MDKSVQNISYEFDKTRKYICIYNFQTILNCLLTVPFSSSVWIYYYIRGSVPSGAVVCPAEQLGRNKARCSEVCVRESKDSCRESGEHWDMVQNTAYACPLSSD